MKGSKKTDKFHFANGLLREMRSKAAPMNKSVAKSASSAARKAAKKTPPKSVLSSLSGSVFRRLLAE
jgi:hypothetical protein